MIAKTLRRFRELPETVRTMVSIYYIYEFAELVVGIFLSIFVFMQTQSILALALYKAVYFAALSLGFVGWGYLMAQWQISLRFNYLRAFFIYFCSFLVLLFLPHTLPYLLLFGALNGLGMGMIWIGVHSYEMIHTKEKNRDFYSSMISAGGQVLGILSPLIATLSFILSERMGLDTYQLLFYLLPIIYLLATPFLFQLPDYVPQKIKWSYFKSLFTQKETNRAQRYYFFQGMSWPLWAVVIPFVAIESLGTVVRVGLLEVAVGLLALVVTLYLSHHRHEGNRLQLLFYAIVGFMLIESLLFFWEYTPWAYVAFSLLTVLLNPIYHISMHVIDLHSVDKVSKDEEFYPALLYRDAILTLARFTGIGMIFALLALLPSETLVLKAAIAGMILLNLPTYWAARSLVRQES